MSLNVQLPDNLEAPQGVPPEGDQAPEQNSEQTAQPEGLTKEAIAELVELDKLEKFKYGGKEWTPKELKESILMRQDYTKKTQELSEARKYADNFDADLAKVIERPELLAKMKSIYPESYIKLAESVLNRAHPSQQQSAQTQMPQQEQKPAVDKELLRDLADLKKWKESQEQSMRQTRVESIEKELDLQFAEMSKKYSVGNEKVDRHIEKLVNNDALMAVEQGQKYTPAMLEKLFKSYQEEFKGYAISTKQQTNQKQIEANKKAKDVGPGGDTPAAAPKKMGLKDAREALFRELNNAR